MSDNFSRRRVLACVAATPVLPLTLSEGAARADEQLVALGRQFDELAGLLDRTAWADDAALMKFGAVEKAIWEREATTMAGLSVKARAACWARLGDLDPSNESTTDKRMAMSIVRDLVRIHVPNLEHPGALAQLVAEATNKV
jgi:hypothetical protein